VIGGDTSPQVGPQDGQGLYSEGKTFLVGGPVSYQNAVSYPIAGDVSSVMTCIVDSIVNPRTVLVQGIDFVIKDATVFFTRGQDPFNDANFRKLQTVQDGVVVTELVMWGSDVLSDKDNVYTYIGYAVGIKGPSTVEQKNMLNRYWDLQTSGTTITRVQQALGSIWDVPTVIEPVEVVDRIIVDTDGTIQVVTNVNVYSLTSDSELRAEVVPGSVLRKGDYLSTAIRLYADLKPLIDSVDLRNDVPYMHLSPAYFRTKMMYGIGADWIESDIVNTGMDTNGNPKLKFDVAGYQPDVDAFWADFWSYCETHGISSETVFQDYIDPVVYPGVGSVYGRVAPLEFFMRYFIATNTAIAVVDRVQLTDTGKQQSAVFAMPLLQNTVPSYTRVVILERFSPPIDEYDLEEQGADAVTVYAGWTHKDTAVVGNPRLTGMTYKDRIRGIRWIVG
jgi:hypothetical protein